MTQESVETLDLFNCTVNDFSVFKNLKNLKISSSTIDKIESDTLETLYISGSLCQIGSFGKFPKLKELTIFNLDMPIDFRNFPALEKLTLYNDKKTSTYAHLPQTLKKLSLYYTRVKKLPVLPNLEVLDLTGSVRVTKLPVLPKLKFLRADKCQRLRKDDFDRQPNLDHLTKSLWWSKVKSCVDWTNDRKWTFWM